MLVTTSGSVYQVSSAGTATLLANLGADTEGLDVSPIGAHFGFFDGQLITASEAIARDFTQWDRHSPEPDLPDRGRH